MTNTWNMAKVSTFEAKAKFSEYLERASKGERIVIYRYSEPIAELRAIEPSRSEPRPVGPIAGCPVFDLPPSFFEPLSEEELLAWEGASAAGGYPAREPEAPARVAEAVESWDKAAAEPARRRTPRKRP